jgi:ribosome maturation factor RimP
MSDVSTITSVVEPVVRSLDLDLEDLRISTVGRRKLVKVVVDGDGGVSLDLVADVSRAVGEALEAASVMGDADWTLEVTSPGVERPLTLPRHWRRAIGRNVKVQFADGREDLGRILEFDEDTGETVFNFKGATRKRNTADIVKAIVQVEFNRKITDAELEPIADEEEQ